jgi:hypothetical protein
MKLPRRNFLHLAAGAAVGSVADRAGALCGEGLKLPTEVFLYQ